MKMGGIHEQHDIEEGSSIPTIQTSESCIRASAFREASSFDGVHCVLLVHGDETRRILRSWMENLGVKVCLVPQLEFLASAVEKLCRVNTSPARASSDSFGCRTATVSGPEIRFPKCCPSYAKMEDMCSEMNFAETKNRIPCKVICLADANTSSSDLRRFRHSTCCDLLVLQKPIHGSRLHALLKALRTSRSRTPNTRLMLVLTATLVEDTLALQTIGKKILHQLGATVEVAEDGAKAVSMFEAALEQAAAGSETDAASTPYDVILMDCQVMFTKDLTASTFSL
jgi:hypothetical protein